MKGGLPTIKLAEMFNSKSLGMSLTARNIFQEINNSNYNKYVIDFSGIIFMGRSFTQEYLYQKMNSKKVIEEINVSEEVEKMFNVVKKDYLEK